MTTPIVFFDLAGPNGPSLIEFYSSVLGWSFDAQGRVAVPVATPIEGAVRTDPAEARLYFGVPDVTSALERIQAAGGSVDTPRFEVPGVAVLGLFRDPAGNPMGLVEMDGDRPRVP